MFYLSIFSPPGKQSHQINWGESMTNRWGSLSSMMALTRGTMQWVIFRPWFNMPTDFERLRAWYSRTWLEDLNTVPQSHDMVILVRGSSNVFDETKNPSKAPAHDGQTSNHERGPARTDSQDGWLRVHLFEKHAFLLNHVPHKNSHNEHIAPVCVG